MDKFLVIPPLSHSKILALATATAFPAKAVGLFLLTAQKKNTPVRLCSHETKKIIHPFGWMMVEEGGFEPPKSVTTDLQSAPFGRSGTPPYSIGAGGRIRTPDLLITNQLLYRLSYTSKYISNSKIDNTRQHPFCQQLFFDFSKNF